MKLVEGFWDCEYCQTKKIGGSLRNCPNCGTPRNKDTEFYMDKKNIKYVPEEKAKNINRNPDWLCPYCDGLNSDDDKICVSCGSERTSENLDYFKIRQKERQDENGGIVAKSNNDINYASYGSRNLSKDSDNLEIRHKNEDISYAVTNCDDTYVKKENNVKKLLKEYYPFIIAGFLTVVTIIVIIFLVIPTEKDITVQKIFWERNIDIERYQPVEENDWEVPDGARVKDKKNEFYGYEPVFDHCEIVSEIIPKESVVDYTDVVVGYSNLGNGYMEEQTSKSEITEIYYDVESYVSEVTRQEEVYRTKYYYEIDKWLYERSVKTNGNDKLVYWGDTNLKSDERESNRSESYYIIALDKNGKSQKIFLSYEDWNSLNVGQTVRVKVSRLGEGEVIE